MGLYEVPLSISLLGFGMGTMLANFHICGIMLVLRAVFNMLVRNASPRGPMRFRCLVFSLSGPSELLFLLWIDRVWSSKECVCCACDLSVYLSVPSIGFAYVFVCRKLSPHLRAGSQVFVLLMLFLCVI